LPEVEWIGDKSVYDDWQNMYPLVDKMLNIGEECYTFAYWIGFISRSIYPAFPPKIRHRFALWVPRINKWILRLISRFGWQYL
jgi:hypothetical protein